MVIYKAYEGSGGGRITSVMKVKFADIITDFRHFNLNF